MVGRRTRVSWYSLTMGVLFLGLTLGMTCKKKNQPPWTPSTPSGPTSAYPGDTCFFSTFAVDPDGDSVCYQMSWGDGDTSSWSSLLPSGDTFRLGHAYFESDTYRISGRARDKSGAASDWSSGHQVTVLVGPNNRPNPPDWGTVVNGGIVGQYIVFRAMSTDPDGDSIYIKFVYDTTRPSRNSGWLGPVPGGTFVTDSAEYDTVGTYYVVAYAKDTKGAISDPSPVKTLVIAPFGFEPWFYYPPNGDAFNSSPAINTMTGDTIIYCGCDNGVFYAFNARTGAPKGSFASLSGYGFSSSPAISTDGQRVYITDDGGWLYCLSATGLSDLSYYPASESVVPHIRPTPAVYGTALYFGCDGGCFCRFDDSSGQLLNRCSYNTGAEIRPSPAISSDGSRIVVGGDPGCVYCFNDTLGLVWKKSLPAPTSSSPAIDGNTVYIGCDDQNLYALSLTDGSIIGTPFLAGDIITSSPVVDAAHNVYFDVDNGTVYCISSGAEVWHKVLPYGERTSATCCLAPDTTLIINTDDGSVYGLDVGPVQPGAVRFRIEWPLPPMGMHRHKTNKLSSSVTIGPHNGMFYAGSSNGGFFSVGVDKPSFLTGSLPLTPWPKFHHDIQNSGWAH